MELHGSKDEIIGFVEGMRLATATESVWYCRDNDFKLETMMDSIKEKIGLETHVVMPQHLAGTVGAFLERSDVLTSTVAWVKEISSVELRFDYRCFSRGVGTDVRAVIEDHLPDSVTLEDYVVEEVVDDEAKGIELYSQAHDYILSGEGRYVGPVPGIFKIAQRLTDQDFINPGKIHFTLVS